jgi:hypothetical protein
MQNAKCKMQNGCDMQPGRASIFVVDVASTFTRLMRAITVCILNFAF